MQNANNDTKIATQLAEAGCRDLAGKAYPSFIASPPAGRPCRKGTRSAPRANSPPSLSSCRSSPWQSSGTPETTAASATASLPCSFPWTPPSLSRKTPSRSRNSSNREGLGQRLRAQARRPEGKAPPCTLRASPPAACPAPSRALRLVQRGQKRRWRWLLNAGSPPADSLPERESQH